MAGGKTALLSTSSRRTDSLIAREVFLRFTCSRLDFSQHARVNRARASSHIEPTRTLRGGELAIENPAHGT